jgi:hypothetical protein
MPPSLLCQEDFLGFFEFFLLLWASQVELLILIDDTYDLFATDEVNG